MIEEISRELALIIIADRYNPSDNDQVDVHQWSQMQSNFPNTDLVSKVEYICLTGCTLYRTRSTEGTMIFAVDWERDEERLYREISSFIENLPNLFNQFNDILPHLPEPPWGKDNSKKGRYF